MIDSRIQRPRFFSTIAQRISVKATRRMPYAGSDAFVATIIRCTDKRKNDTAIAEEPIPRITPKAKEENAGDGIAVHEQ